MSEVATPPAQAAAPAAPAAPAWLTGADPETLGYVQNKGWQSPTDVLSGYQNLEKLVGADRAGRTFTIPKDEADAEGWGQVWAKLGRPESPDGYGIPVPEGQSPDFAKQAASWFHEAGVPKGQALKLAEKWNGYVSEQMQAQQAAEQAALEKEHAQLKQDWGTGPAADMQREIARRAAVKLGLDEEAITALEKVSGFSKTMKALAKMGELLGEHKAEGLDVGTSFGMTPEAARSRKSQLMADPAWRAKAMDPKSAEWADLQRIDQVLAAAMA